MQTKNYVLLCDYAHEQIDYHLNALACRQKLQESERDELRQELLLALMKSSKRYDPDKGTVGTFINVILRREITRFLVTRKLGRRQVVLSVGTFNESEHPAFNETRQGDLSEQDRLYLKNDVDGFTRKMTARQKMICRQLGENKTAWRIAQNLKVELKTVQRDMDRIREVFLDGGYFDTWFRAERVRHGPDDEFSSAERAPQTASYQPP